LVLVPMLLLAPAGNKRWRWSLVVSTLCASVLLVLYGPFVLTGADDSAGLAAMGQHWRFNPLFFRALDVLGHDAVARVVAALLIAAGVAALGWWASRREVAPPLHLALLVLLALSPVVNPWYWLWALPLAVLHGGVAVPAMGVVAVLSYLNTTVLAEVGLQPLHAAGPAFVVSAPIAAVQMLVLVGMVWLELRRQRAGAVRSALLAPTTGRMGALQ
jgi:hypothetical protein